MGVFSMTDDSAAVYKPPSGNEGPDSQVDDGHGDEGGQQASQTQDGHSGTANQQTQQTGKKKFAGKYDTVEEMEAAYKEAERMGQTKAQEAAELRRQNDSDRALLAAVAGRPPGGYRPEAAAGER